MADAVPVTDVLCEAMEYLSKLGANLRIRSDNLKEKRIRKDKLKNFHAVQKAASKVLLICELSKKSIENVESGVKKVLSQIDRSQDQSTSDGGNSSYRSPKHSGNYDYIEHNSKRLRIRKKVNMKHYTSVKVIARKMPFSMQDKYPVYYYCKLYRSRKINSDKLNDKITTWVDTEQRTIQESQSNAEENSDKGLEKEAMKNSESKNSWLEVINNNSGSDENKESSEVDRENGESVRDSKDCAETREREKAEKLKVIDNEEGMASTKDIIKDNTQKERNSSEQTKPSLDSNKNKKQTSNESIVIDSNIVQNNDSITMELNDTSCEKTIDENESCDNINKKFDSEKNERENCKQECTKSDNKESGSDTIIKENSVKNEKKTETGEQDDTDSKPKHFIRCVSLDKLMKTNVEKPKDNETNKYSSVKSKSKISPRKPERSPKKYDRKRRRLYKEPSTSEEEDGDKENDDEYWLQKRKEIKEFKPKKFAVNVVQLPKLTEEYLSRQNLQRITKNGFVVCEVKQKKGENNKDVANKLDAPDINSAKNALLCDSDSDKSKDCIDTPRKVKKALLQDSDSGKEENPLSLDSGQNQKLKSDDKKQNSSSDKEERNNKTPERNLKDNEVDKINELKSSLLRDSAEETHKTPSKAIIGKVSTPPSKRKHIMESMHAKKMLLTYSSSDTEDEQLKNALKEIRDSLLKENSGDECEQVKVKKSKKKKHIRSKKESSSENETNKKLKRSRKDSSKDKGSKKQEGSRKNSASENEESKTCEESGKDSVSENVESKNREGSKKDSRLENEESKKHKGNRKDFASENEASKKHEDSRRYSASENEESKKSEGSRKDSVSENEESNKYEGNRKDLASENEESKKSEGDRKDSVSENEESKKCEGNRNDSASENEESKKHKGSRKDSASENEKSENKEGSRKNSASENEENKKNEQSKKESSSEKEESKKYQRSKRDSSSENERRRKFRRHRKDTSSGNEGSSKRENSVSRFQKVRRK